ncbi:MAG: DUF3883 domain-containing protein [Thermomicrobiales bacterium]
MAEILALQGWSVEDVSRQNIGYDIEGRRPDGTAVYVEVKSLDRPQQPFVLTPNEEGVARLKGSAYLLALVRQTQTHLEVGFIADPIKALPFVRQCRQWLWECSEYEVTPEIYLLS